MDIEKVLLCLFPVFFVGMWSFVLFLLANIGGWSRLARHYQTQTEFAGKKWHFKSGRMGLTNYSACLTVGANNSGLYLAVFPLFRVGHPPLLIPWVDISTSKSKRFWFSYLDFKFTQTPTVTFKIPEQLGTTLLSLRDSPY
jgi:hypothetical protein